MRNGRPLRFLATVLLGWTSLRAIALWPEDAAIAPAALLTSAAEAAPTALAPPKPGKIVRVQILPPVIPYYHRREVGVAFATRPPPHTVVVDQRAAPPALASAPSQPLLPPPAAPPPLAQPPRRWAVSAWAIARGGSDAALLGGQLGASQAGVRATYVIDLQRRLAVSERLAAPLSGRGREAAWGSDWQPTGAPIHVIAEQRLSLDGGRSGPALFVVAGVAPTKLVGPLEVEAYAQAGAVARGRAEPFADGAARLTVPLAAAKDWRLDIGGGAWGGAQRGAARLDLGPSLGVIVPVAGRRLRLTADWRQRVAGQARPGSGPAVSIGSDF